MLLFRPSSHLEQSLSYLSISYFWLLYLIEFHLTQIRLFCEDFDEKFTGCKVSAGMPFIFSFCIILIIHSYFEYYDFRGNG